MNKIVNVDQDSVILINSFVFILQFLRKVIQQARETPLLARIPDTGIRIEKSPDSTRLNFTWVKRRSVRVSIDHRVAIASTTAAAELATNNAIKATTDTGTDAPRFCSTWLKWSRPAVKGCTPRRSREITT